MGFLCIFVAPAHDAYAPPALCRNEIIRTGIGAVLFVAFAQPKLAGKYTIAHAPPIQHHPKIPCSEVRAVPRRTTRSFSSPPSAAFLAPSPSSSKRRICPRGVPSAGITTAARRKLSARTRDISSSAGGSKDEKEIEGYQDKIAIARLRRREPERGEGGAQRPERHPSRAAKKLTSRETVRRRAGERSCCVISCRSESRQAQYSQRVVSARMLSCCLMSSWV